MQIQESERTNQRKKARGLVHKKLIFRLRMFLVILLAMAVIVIYDLGQNIIGAPLALAGIALGFIIGIIVGHFSNIHWHEETSKIITRLDRIGIVILIIYLAFSFSRKWIFGHWLHGPTLTAFCFSIALGIMSGRFFSTRRQIINILKEQGSFHND